MSIPVEYAYLIGILPVLLIWGVLFVVRKDLRKPMLVMSILIGVLSMLTSYFWWTKDWWQPATIEGTKIGIEDFLLGFGSGGIMAVAYEELFGKHRYRRMAMHYPGGRTVIILLILIMVFLLGLFGLTSFIASTITMTAVAIFMFYYRRDLIQAGIVSGLLMVIASLPFYFLIMAISPGWIAKTYLFQYLSGFLIFGIPVEEIVFWFFAGLVWGPFYEYWQKERLRRGRV